MRKHFVWVVGLILALMVPAVASAENFQTVDVTVKPKKAFKKTASPVGINVITSTGPIPPATRIGPAYRARIFLDKDFAFYNKGLPTCTKDQLNTSPPSPPATVLKNCGKARVGQGAAIVGLAGDPNLPLNATVYAFNGKPIGGKIVLYLYAYQEDTGLVTVLTGVLKNAPGRKFGKMLDVAIDPLTGGTAIARFQVNIKKNWRHKGQKRSFVSAKCSRKKWFFKGTFDFHSAFVPGTNDNPASKSDSNTLTCKQKPEPRKKRR